MTAPWVWQSPSRWPGSKRRLAARIASLVGNCEQLVEPFAGGASVSLELLRTGQVSRAVIGDADPNVHAFWATALNDTEWLIDAFASAEVSVVHVRRRLQRPLDAIRVQRAIAGRSRPTGRGTLTRNV